MRFDSNVFLKVIGNGSFGVVYLAKLVETNELVAIKKVLQDKRFKVRYLILILVFHEKLFGIQFAFLILFLIAF